MTKNKFLVAGFLVLALMGCTHPPEVRKTQGNGIEVDKLFTYEGCTVYRFYDSGDYIYYTNCTGGTTTTTWNRSCGKGCRRLVTVPTRYY